MNGINRAVEYFGTQANLARALNVSKQFVHQWLTGAKPFPWRYCRVVEELTDGKITRYDLRPDMYGDPPKPKRKAKAA